MKASAAEIVKAGFKVTDAFGVPKFLPTVERTGNSIKIFERYFAFFACYVAYVNGP
jgi:hypothetical protein